MAIGGLTGTDKSRLGRTRGWRGGELPDIAQCHSKGGEEGVLPLQERGGLPPLRWMKVKAADALLFHNLTLTHSVQSVGFRYWFSASGQIFWSKEKGGQTFLKMLLLELGVI